MSAPFSPLAPPNTPTNPAPRSPQVSSQLSPQVSSPGAFDRGWPRPPRALPHGRLNEPPAGALVTVAGLVLVRQRPGTAKGVIFLTLEDETGISNIVVWEKTYLRYRRAVVSGRLLRVTGHIQRESGVVHVIARRIEDISALLDTLIAPPEG